METKFCPRTRNEIKDCSWFWVDQLPSNRNDEGYIRDQKRLRANSFYMILPFISKLKHWIMNERLGNAMGHRKKQQHGQRNINKKAVGAARHPMSPFLNLDNQHQARNSKQRHKSTGDSIESYNSPSNHGTFYNDHLKLQNNSSTPIAGTHPFMPSSTSAFRATNSENKLTNFKKKPKGNGKLNQSIPAVNVQQEQFKRKLFTEPNGASKPIKPFTFGTSDDMPDCWKNFKFDRHNLFT